jgi:putative tryptophan/tyrosine transport system substrate-binding protein
MNRTLGRAHAGLRGRIQETSAPRHPMRRKLLFNIVAAALSLPFSVFSQHRDKVWRVGYLTLNHQTADEEFHLAFMQGMRDLGYVEGKNLAIERRSPGGSLDRLPGLAAELVRLKVDVILARGTQCTAAAQKASATMPIVMVGVGDPISSGFIKSLARPARNITGLASLTPDLSHKQLEMLLGVRPKLAHVAVLVDPHNATHTAVVKSMRVAAAGVGIKVLPVEARNSTEIAQALSAANRAAAGAVIVNGGAFNRHLPQISALAAKHGLASISAFREFAQAGGLMSYGQNLSHSFRRAATYVDKILKGTKPADIPVEQPAKFELLINMKTVKALGLTLPQSLLLQADGIIE